MKNIKAVLFDMDGLMVDSEPFHLKAFNEELQKYGKYITEEENAKLYMGMSPSDESKDMVKRYDLPILAEELALAKQNNFRHFLAQEVNPQPGLLKLLQDLSQSGFKIAFASGSVKENIETVINKFQIGSLIDAYCSTQEVEKGKPAPDVYLLAAQRIGIKPDECLVLEDAPKGVEAAKAAGMTCFAIPSGSTKGLDFSLADKVLNSLSEVFELIK